MTDNKYNRELKAAKIVDKWREADNTVSLTLKPLNPLKCDPLPPQFIMLWLPGVEEIPLSIVDYKDDILRVTVRDRGPTSHKLVYDTRIGEILGFRGPFGKPFTLNKDKYVLIAGGLGAPPILFTLKTLLRKGVKDVVYVVGARTKSLLLYVDEVKSLGVKVHVATDDGSAGFKGLVTELIDKIIDMYDGYEFIACGPSDMLRTLSLKLYELGYYDAKVIAESIVKCGMGVCGSCVLGKGLLLCTDGPWFTVKDYVEKILSVR